MRGLSRSEACSYDFQIHFYLSIRTISKISLCCYSSGTFGFHESHCPISFLLLSEGHRGPLLSSKSQSGCWGFNRGFVSRLDTATSLSKRLCYDVWKTIIHFSSRKWSTLDDPWKLMLSTLTNIPANLNQIPSNVNQSWIQRTCLLNFFSLIALKNEKPFICCKEIST